MKLNTDKYDQHTFSTVRVVFCLVWLRLHKYVPGFLKVGFRDKLMLLKAHYLPSVKKWLKPIVKFKNRFRK